MREPSVRKRHAAIAAFPPVPQPTRCEKGEALKENLKAGSFAQEHSRATTNALLRNNALKKLHTVAVPVESVMTCDTSPTHGLMHYQALVRLPPVCN